MIIWSNRMDGILNGNMCVVSHVGSKSLDELPGCC